MEKYIWGILLCVVAQASCAQDAVVNGCAALWNKRYNEVAYAATHNGSSYLACPVQNQDIPLLKQFECGVRATKIHVWNSRGSNGESVPYVCHGVTTDIFEGPYLDKVIEKIPSLFQGWARDVLKQMEPINDLVRDAFKIAYGDAKNPGVAQFDHCIFDPSRKQLVEVLTEIKKFMTTHPHEVITLILENHTKDPEKIAHAFNDSGLMDFVHVQDISKPWPLLGEMVQGNKRLVVFVHSDDEINYEKYPWMHNMWHFGWDTEWNFSDISAMKNESKDVMPKRGEKTFVSRFAGPKNKVFVVHHFVTPTTGGCKKSAKKVNHKSFLQARIDRLKKSSGQIPNIIQVDFFQYPNNDIFEVVNALNEA